MKCRVCYSVLTIALLALVWSGGCTNGHAEPQTQPEPQAEPQPQPKTNDTQDAVPPAEKPEIVTGAERLTRMIDQFAASETLELHLRSDTKKLGRHSHEFKLKRPNSAHTIHKFRQNVSIMITNGEEAYLVNPSWRRYFRLPVLPDDKTSMGLLPDMFRRADKILAGDDPLSAGIAAAEHVSSELADGKPCDVVKFVVDDKGSQALFWLDDNSLPVQFEIQTADGRRLYEVKKLNLNVEFPEDEFIFVPDPDIDWIEQPQPAAPGETPDAADEAAASEAPTETSDE